jgi:hypothetical protein
VALEALCGYGAFAERDPLDAQWDLEGLLLPVSLDPAAPRYRTLEDLMALAERCVCVGGWGVD